MVTFAALISLMGLPVGILFRALREENAFLKSLLKEQLAIAAEQNDVQKETVKVIRQKRP